MRNTTGRGHLTPQSNNNLLSAVGAVLDSMMNADTIDKPDTKPNEVMTAEEVAEDRDQDPQPDQESEEDQHGPEHFEERVAGR